MTNLSLDWWIEEYMIFCRSRQLRGKTLDSYEQGLFLFERWAREEQTIAEVTEITGPVIRRYIVEVQERGRYTTYVEHSRAYRFLLSAAQSPRFSPRGLCRFHCC